jgi:hypothetical protein
LRFHDRISFFVIERPLKQESESRAARGRAAG